MQPEPIRVVRSGTFVALSQLAVDEDPEWVAPNLECVLLGLSNHHDQKRSGLLSPRRSAARLGRRRFSVLGGGKKDLLRLGIESHRLRSGLSRDRSRVFVNVRRLLAVDAQGSSPARKEDQLGVRIES